MRSTSARRGGGRRARCLGFGDLRGLGRAGSWAHKADAAVVARVNGEPVTRAEFQRMLGNPLTRSELQQEHGGRTRTRRSWNAWRCGR